MVELTRTVRFFLNDPGSGHPPPRHNGFSAWPPARGLGRFLQLHVCCRGAVDPVTGYLMNIKQIDKAVRDHAIGCMQHSLETCGTDAQVAMGSLMRRLIEVIQPPWQRSVHALRLGLSPYHSVTIRSDDMEHVLTTQQFEFAAAHRLHVPQLSDDRNRQVFGKCNNPSGHGHNYPLEVVVRSPIGTDGTVLSVDSLDELVDETVVQYLDHKHLNIDVPEFADVNPSVENITKLVYGMLIDRVRKLGAQLEAVSVWETPKTKCTYRGDGD